MPRDYRETLHYAAANSRQSRHSFTPDEAPLRHENKQNGIITPVRAPDDYTDLLRNVIATK